MIGFIAVAARRLHGAGEHGFSMVVAMGTLLVGGLLVLAAIAATQPGIGLSGGDRDRKLAYAVAEAGLAYYQYRLDQDVNYWTYCTAVNPPSASEPSPVNERWADGAPGPDPRRWRSVPDSRGQYTIELLPAVGETCSSAAMLDAATGTFRVRATGRVGDERRSVIATLRRKGFLDYIYFTDFETLDPFAYSTSALRTQASTACARYERDGRVVAPSGSSSPCVPIQFRDTDDVRGPFHTNDELRICGSPTFGRDAADRIEIAAPAARAYEQVCGSPATGPDFQGTFVPSADVVGVPPTNGALKDLAAPAYSFTGKTVIELSANSMTVTNPAFGTKTLPLPTNGVVYVHSSACTSQYARQQTYSTTATGCGDLWVEGSYSGSLTLAAENDVVINGDLTRSGDPLLGLIANNFVRVYHPVDFGSSPCSNAANVLQTVTIDAAILALAHSFIVDNWYCGANLGTLRVFGAIAQRFRGPVATSSSGVPTTGYTKDYEYDNRLRHREPPHFIDPVQAAWRISRQHEQTPAR